MKAKSQRPIANSNTESLILYLDTSEPEAVLAIYYCKGQTLVKCKGLTLVTGERWLAHRELSATLSEKYQKLLLAGSKKIYTDKYHQHPEQLEQVEHLQKSLAGIVVFVGPGSFTGLRIGISFANALAYALKIPIYETKEKESFNLKYPKEIAVPFYGAAPNITKPKKK